MTDNPSLQDRLTSISEGLRSLKESLATPDPGDVTIETVEKLYQKCVFLKSEEDKLRDGDIHLIRFLVSLKANKTDPIGRKVIEEEFWKTCSLPDEDKPKQGDTYLKMYTVKSKLHTDVTHYEKFGMVELRAINNGLSDVESDLRMLKDGHLDMDEHVFSSSDWASLVVTKPVTEPAPQVLRWGDLLSSSEDEGLMAALNSLVKKGTNTSPGITMPADFDECFPTPARKLRHFCNTYQWEYRTDKETNLRSQGLIQFSEEKSGAINSDRLDDMNRVALASFYAVVASLSIQPGSLVEKENTEVAVTYVCSLVARKVLGEKDPAAMKIALKNGDGGKIVLHNRFMSLTRTGSSAMTMVINAIEKVLEKFIRELDSDHIKGKLLEQITARSFTSIDGMMENAYKVTPIDEWVAEETTNRKGKTVTVKNKRTRLKRIVPDLTATRNPLKPAEVSKLEQVKEKFNNRKAEIEKRIGGITNPDFLSRPKTCQEVVTEAYAKLAPFRTLMRERMSIIREAATKACDGKKPTRGAWVTAQAQYLKDAEEIPSAVWDSMGW